MVDEQLQSEADVRDILRLVDDDQLQAPESAADALNGLGFENLPYPQIFPCSIKIFSVEIFKELLNFIDRKKISGDLLIILQQKPPSRYEIMFPAFLLYELIEDIRNRINKGLRVAETAVRESDKKDQAQVIKELRKKYREALREGIIDSKEDVDLILLARELDALLVTADQGVIKWAEKLGIKWLFPEKFRDYLLSAIKKAKAGL